MRIVSPFLKSVLYPAVSTLGVFRLMGSSGLAVVTYHGVAPQGYDAVDAALDGNLVTADTLRQQLRFLRAHYNVVPPEDVLAWREGRGELPPRAVLLTCDDGLLNCLTDMVPVLQEQAVKCLFFVTGASAQNSPTMLWYEKLFLLYLRAPAGSFKFTCGDVPIQVNLDSRERQRASWWSSVKRLTRLSPEERENFLAMVAGRFDLPMQPDLQNEHSATCRRFALLTGDELQRLCGAGMTIGAHTMSHPILSQVSVEQAHAEIAESRQRIESAIGKRVWAFAYPFGDPQSVTAEVLDMPKKAGYQLAFLNYGGGLGAELPPYAMPRLHVTAEMQIAELDAHLSGFYRRLRGGAGHRLQPAGAADKKLS